jgi:hypothetical protein
VEVHARLQAAALEDRLDDFSRRTGIGGRLEDDHLAFSEARRNLLDGALDDREIRLALARQRCRQRDEDRVRFLEHGVVRAGGDGSTLDELLQDLRGDVADVTLATVDPIDDLLVDVDEHHCLTRIREDLGQGHADIAGTDDCNVPLHDAEGYTRRSPARPSAEP